MRPVPTPANITLVAGYIRFLICTAGVCNQVFNIHNCRILDKDHRVLRMDYSIDCNDPKHKTYTVIALLMIVGFAFGIPIGLGILMVRRMREYSSKGGTDRFVARRVADEMKITDVEAADAKTHRTARRLRHEHHRRCWVGWAHGYHRHSPWRLRVATTMEEHKEI